MLQGIDVVDFDAGEHHLCRFVISIFGAGVHRLVAEFDAFHLVGIYGEGIAGLVDYKLCGSLGSVEADIGQFRIGIRGKDS